MAAMDAGSARLLLKLLSPIDALTGKPIPQPVRWSAVQALGKMRDTAAIPFIQAAVDASPINEEHPEQLNFAIQAAAALGEIGSKDAEPALVPLLHSVLPVANSAVVALAKLMKGTPERFFSLVEKSGFNKQAALPAWMQSMAELGGVEGAAELNRLLLQSLENPGTPHSELLPTILTSLARINPPGFQDTLQPFLRSQDTVLLRAAISAYQPNANGKEPWKTFVRALENCAASGDSRTKAEILLRLTPWVGEAEVQQELWTGFKDPDRRVRIASLALLRKSGISGAIEDPGASTASVRDVVYRMIAASRKNSTIANVATTRGTLEIELFREDAPLTVANFLVMARGGALNGYIFGQVVPFQRIESRDVRLKTGAGRTLDGEVNPRPFERGSVGLTADRREHPGGLFFIALAPQPYQDGIDTCFGRVISGIQVADRIVPGDKIIRIDIKDSVRFPDYVRY
jgi:peptidyl-prolyl cis-trans isomerase B (cyclophilin B)